MSQNNLENGLDIETKQIDNKALDDLVTIRSRKKWVWVVSFVAIIVITTLIITLICGLAVVFYLSSAKISQATDLSYFQFGSLMDIIKNCWHIYLISLVALTTMLSAFIYLNRSTWMENKTDGSENRLTDLVKTKELVFKLK